MPWNFRFKVLWAKLINHVYWIRNTPVVEDITWHVKQPDLPNPTVILRVWHAFLYFSTNAFLMYLLQQSQSTSFIVYLLALSITFLILYFIIRFAIVAALKDVKEKSKDPSPQESIRVQNRLLVELLLSKGISYSRIEELMDLDKQPFDKFDKP